MACWHQGGVVGCVSAGGEVPLTSLEPIPYLSALFARQPYYPLTLTPSYLWLFDSGTDLVTSSVLTAQNGATIGVTPLETVNLQSKLVRGIASFSAVNHSLRAASAAVMEVGAGSALLVWIMRTPARPGATMGLINKRAGLPDTEGYECGINSVGEALCTVKDPGGTPATPVTVTLTEDETGGQTKGTWRVHALLVDALGGFVQSGSDRELGTQTAWSGDLSSPTLFSVGAGRLQALTSDVLLVAGFFGSQVEGLFVDVGDGSGPNLRANLCQILALDTIWGYVAVPYPEG